jgi:hypothetical protein
VTLTVEDDFREFVAARWPDLEAVAFVVTLDAPTARRVTTQALAALHQHWSEALDEGRPGAVARRAVLTAALAAAPSTTQKGSATTVPAAPSPDTAPNAATDPWGVPDEDDPVLTALEAVVRAASPLERALVGAASVWAAGPDEVADLLGMPPANVRESATTLRRRLVGAHDAARVAQGLAPADWALDVDLDAVVENLLAGQGDPPDPAALVDEQRRSVRRRSLVVGGAAALAAGAAAWWVVPRGPDTPPSGGSASPSPSGPPSADDPSWARPSRWAARGRLATDARVQALVVSRSTGFSRLLFADDVSGRRVVVTGTLNAGTEDLIVQAWHGEQGADPTTLDEVPFQSAYVAENQDAMALTVPRGPGTLLLVLARPTAPIADYSRVVTATVEGSVHRDWERVTLEGGIGSTLWPEEVGPALRVRCAGFDGPAFSTAQTWVGQGGTDALAGFAEETSRHVAAAIGLPRDKVRSEVVTDAVVVGSVIDPTAISAAGGDGRVRVLRTTTWDGAVIRSVRVVDDGRSGMSWLDLEPPAVLPAATPLDEPIVLRLDDARPGVGRFLVIAPGAARVQLLATSPNAYPVSKVTAIRHGVAVVPVVNANDAAAFRLVRRDAAGRKLGDGVPHLSRDLLDLWAMEDRRVI